MIGLIPRGRVLAPLQEHAADDDDVNADDHHDFEIETGLGPGRDGALRDERIWIIHIDAMLSFIF